MNGPTPAVLSRYAELVANEQAFVECCLAPLPTTGWIHPERPLPLGHFFSSTAPSSKNAAWHSRLFRTENTLEPSFLAAFLSGSLLIQEESAITAVELLGLSTGQSVLDLCAAPGNKTAQLSLAVGDTGSVIANDISKARLGVVHTTIDRLGLANVTTSAHDAREFPIPETGFDAVLADVPCTCEGTSRKYPNILDRTNDSERKRLIQIQRGILLRAVQCVKPGGLVMYSTCTYAPEENEGVISWMLSQTHHDVEVELTSISIPGFQLAPGITFWKGEHFDASVAKCARVWPHANNTGGFFLALLKRKDPNGQGSREQTSRVNGGELAESTPINLAAWPWTTHHFDTEIQTQWGMRSFSHKYNRFVGQRNRSIHGLNVISSGITGLNLKSEYPKLSTALAQKVGAYATNDIAEIEQEQILPFFNRELIPAYSVQRSGSESNTLIVRSGHLSLGLASWDEQRQRLISRFPKVWGGLTVSERIYRSLEANK